MLSLWRSLGLGYLRRRPLRSLLVAFSIALGVATLVATQSLRRGIVQGKRDPFSLGEVIVTNSDCTQAAKPDRAARKMLGPNPCAKTRDLVRSLIRAELKRAQEPRRAGVTVMGWAPSTPSP